MSDWSCTTGSVAETEALGRRVGEQLAPGAFVGLTGDLGAGKTAFVRGVALGAGVPPGALVSSPTFAIVNAYAGGRLPVHHADLYRLRDAEELYDAGFYDLAESGGAMLVEWIDRVPQAVPDDWLHVRLRREGTGRRLELEAHGPAAQKLLDAVRSHAG
jgi:tRNA threonylcarbamoyladenosine biosynthesis protein TsaE